MLVRNLKPSGSEASVEARSTGRRRRILPHFGSEDGQSLIEFALCLPALLMVVTGITTFGIAMNNYLMLTNATNTGARQLAISRSQTLDPCATVVAAVTAGAPFLKSANLTFSFVLNGTSYSGTSCSSSSYTTGAAGQLTQGATAQVTVTYPCSLSIYKMNLGTCLLKAQTSEYVQ